jgi:hypothetical protein
MIWRETSDIGMDFTEAACEDMNWIEKHTKFCPVT